jgi:hypothetical protein
MSLTTLSCFVGLGLGLAASGCAGRSVAVPSPSPAPPPSARLTEPRPVDGGPDVVATPARRPTPPTPPAEGREAAALLQNVCQLAALPNATPGVPSFGCACCAPFDGCKPSDAPVVADQAVYFPTQVVSGAFTSAGAEQRALPMAGCEPHSENYGGMVLLERSTQGFGLHRYVSGLSADQCWPVRRDDGRDVLVCTRSDVHQGTAEQQLFVWDFAASDAELLQGEPLLFVNDNEMSGCWSERGMAVSSTEMAVPRLGKRAGHIELTIELDVREGKVTAAYLARCKELQDAPDNVGSNPKRRPRTLLAGHTERLVFRFDGSKFVRR